ncbi:MAG: S41 family peptidase [Bacillota bacterium]
MVSKRSLWVGALVLIILTSAVNYALIYAGYSLFGRVIPMPGRAPSGMDARTWGDLGTVYQYVKAHYVEEVPDEQLVEGALAGLLAGTGDPYSTYLPPDVWRAFNEQVISGDYTGIGVSVEQKDGYPVIITPFANSPAARAGLRPGDYIIAVEGENIEGIPLDVVVKKIIGPEGTQVRLTISRPGQSKPFDLTLTRSRVTIERVFAKMVDGNIGYIQVSGFTADTGVEFERKLGALLAKNPVGLIVDLRYNSGGELNSGISVGEQLIPSGPVVNIVGRDGKQRTYGSGRTKVRVPMAVLINEFSASAAEIVAAAIKDSGQATLIGTTTFGKGSIQQLIALGQNRGIKLTVQRYYSPLMKTVDRVGVAPDIEVERDPDESLVNMADEDNRILHRAIEVLRGR